MTTQDEELTEMRCRSCGMFMGWRRRSGRFIFWCSEECADTTMPKFEDTQIRDEVAVELALEGVGIMAIANINVPGLDGIQYQQLQQNLNRRNITATSLSQIRMDRLVEAS